MGDGDASLRALLEQVRALLARSAFVPDAYQEAQWLIERVLGCGSVAVVTHPGMPVPAEVAARAMRLAERRAAGEPLQYVLGDAYFRGHRFLCDARALIPRPETEVLVECALERLSDIPRPRIADVCTGSGCIAICVALERPDCTVVATDISPQALELAAENARLHAVTDRVELAEGDLFAPLAGCFDALLINPPYIPSREIDGLGADIAAEPRQALGGGVDGLDVYRRIAAGWRSLLEPSGFLALEVGVGQAEAVVALLSPPAHQVVHDLSGIPRVLVAWVEARP